MKLFSYCLIPVSLSALFFGTFVCPTLAQSASQATNSSSKVEGSLNNVIQIPNQNNAQNSNNNEIDVSYIAPLIAPANTEHDLGFNLSAGFNQQQTTIFLGIIYQPGRSKYRRMRMDYLQQQTQLLETQNKIAEAELKLLYQDLTNIDDE